MFDFRYHVASLAAVFFALVIGILVGVALASHGLGNTERKRLEEDLRRAESQGDVLRNQVETLVNGAAADRAFVEGTYKSVMASRLKGKKIAVLFIGSSEKARRSAIATALADASAGSPLRIRFVKVPVDPNILATKLANKPALANYAGPGQLENLGHDLGQEFVAGTDTPLWSALQNVIVEEKIGPAKPPVDGVVIVRSVAPQTGPTALFLEGLYAGLADVGVPAVGVERTNDEGSAIQAFQRAGISTVDDIETQIGKLALVALLADPMLTGSYGTKKTAQAPLPPIAPLPATASG
ncbi:MAG: copper transporter [Actinomycetota bacterium]|nr:copper transporter [Actinomycetota bacterium]